MVMDEESVMAVEGCVRDVGMSAWVVAVNGFEVRSALRVAESGSPRG